MTKTQLAAISASRSSWYVAIPFVVIFVALLIFFSGAAFFLEVSIKKMSIEYIESHLRQHNPKTITSKSLDVKSYTKRSKNNTISSYEVITIGKETKKEHKIKILVLNEFESFLLKDMDVRKILILPTYDNKLISIYPSLDKWKEPAKILRENIYSDAIAPAFNFFSFMLNDLSLPSKEGKAPLIELILCSILSVIGCITFMRRRRGIFLKNFKVVDLEKAETCTISPAFFISPLRGVYPFQGKVYNVNEKEGISVIFNGSKSNKIAGRLLKYENQFFFIPDNLKLKSSNKKAA